MLTKLIRQVVFIIVFLELSFLVFYFRLPSYFIPNQLVRAETPRLQNELLLFGLDWYPPQISINNPTRELRYLKTELSLRSSEQIDISNLPKGWKLGGEYLFNSNYYYVLSTNNINDGNTNVDLVFTDQAGNTVTKRISLKADSSRTSVTEWKDFNYTSYPSNILSLASKKNKLPEDFVPTNLVPLSSLGIRNNNNAQLRGEATNLLKDMTQAISSARIDYTVTSAYRSYAQQVSAYGFWLGYYSGNVDATDLVSARPGFSEHQLGSTLDFVTSANGYVFSGFQFTPLSDWLSRNAYKYGFVLSYPEGKTNVTGYSFEPWHYRFIGKQNAKKFIKSGLTLVEWLEIQEVKSE